MSTLCYCLQHAALFPNSDSPSNISSRRSSKRMAANTPNPLPQPLPVIESQTADRTANKRRATNIASPKQRAGAPPNNNNNNTVIITPTANGDKQQLIHSTTSNSINSISSVVVSDELDAIDILRARFPTVITAISLVYEAAIIYSYIW